jgi:hypothetical protein
MLFSYDLSQENLKGKLFAGKRSLNFRTKRTKIIELLAPEKFNQAFCLAFNYLEVSIDIEGKKLLYPDGYFPKAIRIKKALPKFEIVQGVVTLTTEMDLLPGRLKHVEGTEDWKVIYDETTLWIYFGPEEIHVGDVNVEFAENVVASITDNRIISLWLHPVNLRLSFAMRLKTYLAERFGIQWGK